MNSFNKNQNNDNSNVCLRSPNPYSHLLLIEQTNEKEKKIITENLRKLCVYLRSFVRFFFFLFLYILFFLFCSFLSVSFILHLHLTHHRRRSPPLCFAFFVYIQFTVYVCLCRTFIRSPHICVRAFTYVHVRHSTHTHACGCVYYVCVRSSTASSHRSRNVSVCVHAATLLTGYDACQPLATKLVCVYQWCEQHGTRSSSDRILAEVFIFPNKDEKQNICVNVSASDNDHLELSRNFSLFLWIFEISR